MVNLVLKPQHMPSGVNRTWNHSTPFMWTFALSHIQRGQEHCCWANTLIMIRWLLKVNLIVLRKFFYLAFLVPTFQMLDVSACLRLKFQAAEIPASCPLSVLDQVSALVCSDTSEIRDVVVLLQHGQGGGIQVVSQACTAHCWCGRVLATTTNTTVPLSPARIVHGKGGGVPGTGGGGLKGTRKGWR